MNAPLSGLPPDSEPDAFDRLILALLLCLAVALRCGVAWYRADQLAIDRDAYLGIAENIATGNGFCTPGTTTPTAFRPPLYPILLAIHLPYSSSKASVTDLEDQAWAVGFWNVLAGLWTVCFVDQIGRSLGLGRRRHLATLLVAVDPLLLNATAQPMTEVVFSALTTAWLWAMICPSLPERMTLRSLWIGVLFGLAAVCRPTIWPLAGLMAVARFIPPAARPGLRRNIKHLVAIAAGALLIVSPWVVRNSAVFGRPILMTTHGGYTLLLANNPVYQREVIEQPWGTIWSGASLARWQNEVEQRLHQDLGPRPSELERDAWMSAEAKRYILSEPVKFVSAAMHRIRCLWSIAPQGEGKALPGIVRTGVAMFYLLEFSLALVGLWRIVRHGEWPNWLPALLLIAAIQGVHLAYWTDTRMRAPLEPVVALLAARGLMGARQER